MSEFTADQLEELFHAALKFGDVQAVGHVLRALLALDPRRAIRLHDDLQTALRVAPFLGFSDEDSGVLGAGHDADDATLG